MQAEAALPPTCRPVLAHAAAPQLVGGWAPVPLAQASAPMALAASKKKPPPALAPRRQASSKGSEWDSSGMDAAAPAKRKRVRNMEQMQHNRVAQQKYRERKRAEQEAMQATMDALMRKLESMQGLEVRGKGGGGCVGRVAPGHWAALAAGPTGASCAHVRIRARTPRMPTQARTASLEATTAHQARVIEDLNAHISAKVRLCRARTRARSPPPP